MSGMDTGTSTLVDVIEGYRPGTRTKVELQVLETPDGRVLLKVGDIVVTQSVMLDHHAATILSGSLFKAACDGKDVRREGTKG